MKGGTIYQEGKKWVWKSPPYEENGVKKRTRKTFNTEEEALAQRERFLVQIHESGNNYISGLTVREAYNKWVANTWSNEEHISYNTQRGYVALYKKHIFPYVGELQIDNLNVRPFVVHLQQMADDGLSQKTLNNTKQALCILLDYATEMGWIDVNNRYKIKTPKAKKRPKARVVNLLTEAEYQAIQKTMDYNCSQYAPVVRFLRETGIRAEELAIKESDINENSFQVVRAVKRKDTNADEHNSVLTVSDILKTSAAYRTVPLTKEAKNALKEVREWKAERGIKSEYVFCTRTGALIDERNVLRAYHTAIKQTELDGNPLKKRGLHSLRKLFCKTLKDLPTEWEQVRAIMGHESVAVTQRYYYSMDEDDIDDIAERLSNR